jgi:hypothetical protein
VICLRKLRNTAIQDVCTAEMPAAAVTWRLCKNGPEEATVECPVKGGLLLHWHKPVGGLRAGNQHSYFPVLDLRSASCLCAASSGYMKLKFIDRTSCLIRLDNT